MGAQIQFSILCSHNNKNDKVIITTAVEYLLCSSVHACSVASVMSLRARRL